MAKKLGIIKDHGTLAQTLFNSEHIIVMDYLDYRNCILDQPIAPELRQWVEHNLDMMTVILGEQFSDRADIDKYYLDIKIIAGLKPLRQQR